MNAAKARIPWPDYVKGLAILLVVLGHVILGLQLASLEGADADAGLNGWQFTVDWIYAFHMAAFFFISGMLACHSSRKTMGGFLGAKLRTIVYPYFVWSVIQILLMLAMAGRTRHEVHWTDLITIVYQPVMQFWFLYALFAMLILFAILRKLRFAPSGILTVCVLLYCCCLPLQLPISMFENFWSVAVSVCSNAIYFGAGVYASRWILEGMGKVTSVRLAATTAVCYVLITLGVYGIASLELTLGKTVDMACLKFAARPILAFLGIAMLASMAELASRTHSLGILSFLGVVSLEIYVAHTMAAAGSRIILSRIFHVENTWMQLTVGMFAGVLFPVVLWWVCRKIKFPYLFAWPERKKKTAVKR